MDLTVADWEKIGQTPTLVFAAIAKSDGSVSKDEHMVFASR
jgi:hypothetical protein